MREKYIFYFAAALCFLLAGCGWKHVMIGPDGDVRVCYASGSEPGGVLMASNESENCMASYKAKGYKEDESQRYWYQKPDAPGKESQESPASRGVQKGQSPIKASDWVYAGKNGKGDVAFYYERSSIVRGDKNKSSVVVKMLPSEGSLIYKNMQANLIADKGRNVNYSYSVFNAEVNCGNDMFRLYNEKSYDNKGFLITVHRSSDWQDLRKISAYYAMIKEKLCKK